MAEPHDVAMTTSDSSRPAPLGKPSREPGALIAVGALVLVVGWLVSRQLAMNMDASLAWALLVWTATLVGGVLVLVGAVAAGVRLGMRWVEHDRH
jgi:hypothetical protein